MEDISKALLIAAAVFFAILLLSALVLFYNQVSTFYNTKHEATVMEQTQKFNSRFENYNRKDVRGNDLISLMNKVINYNQLESYDEGTNYPRIRVTIRLGNENILKEFDSPNANGTSINRYLTHTITNTTADGEAWKNDKELIAITNTSSEMIQYLNAQEGIDNVTDTKLRQLATNAPNIIISENGDRAVSNRFKRAEIIEEILGIKVGITPNADQECKIVLYEANGRTKIGQSIMDAVINATSQYYQYNQFKKAHFDCTEMTYDDETNRVVEMKFVLQTKNGKVVFD